MPKSSLDAFWDDDEEEDDFWDEASEAPPPPPVKPKPKPTKTIYVHRRFIYDSHECHVYHPQQNPDQPLEFIHDCRRRENRFYE